MKALICLFLSLVALSAYGAKNVAWKLCPGYRTCIPWKQLAPHYLSKFTIPSPKRIRLYAKVPCKSGQKHQGIYLPQVHDAFSLKLNGKYIRHWNNLDMSSDNALIQLPTYLCKKSNYLEIDIYNLNESVIGLVGETQIGNYAELYWKAKIDYWLLTGQSILSGHFLLYLSFLVGFFILYRSHARLLYLLQYCLISSFYMISLSKIPGALLYPKIVSSSFYFGIIFLQGLSFLLVIRAFWGWRGKSDLLFKSFVFVYIVLISTFLYIFLFTQEKYNYEIKLMLLSTPMILAPSVYLFHILIGQESKHYLLATLLAWTVFVGQINDIMVFWGLYQGLISMKFLIPISAVALIVLHFKSLSELMKAKELLASKSETISAIVHDLKIPLDILQVLLKNGISEDLKSKEMLRSSVERLSELTSDLLDQQKVLEKTDVAEIARLALNEQKIIFNVKESYVKEDVAENIFIKTYPGCLKRVLANLLKNAFAASQFQEGRESVRVQLTQTPQEVILEVENNGEKINKAVVEAAHEGSRLFSNHSGNGIGLAQVMKVSKALGWDFNIYPMQNGTISRLVIKKGSI